MPEPANAPSFPQHETSQVSLEQGANPNELAIELGGIALTTEFIPASRQDAIDSAVASLSHQDDQLPAGLVQQQNDLAAARDILARIYNQPQLQN
jgi:hypothetical protein